MRTNTTILLGMVLLAVVFVTGCTQNAQSGAPQAGGDGGEDQAQLEVRGSPGTEFSGSCTVGDKEPEEIGGQVPKGFTYDLNGRSLECEIASEEVIEVDLTAGNDRSVQQVGGGTLSLTYDNGSISSSTSSSSTSSQVVSSSGEPVEEPSVTTNGSGNVTRESRDVSGFDEVELKGIGNLSVRQTGSESLTVTAEEDVLPKIRTEVVNDRLVIGPEPNTSIRTSEPIDYELTVDDLHALEVSGSGGVEAQGIKTDGLSTAISGSGAVKMSGRAESQEVDVSGSGDYRAEDLESEEAKVDIAGSGSAVVNVNDALDAEVSGAGSVEYVGDPAVEKNVSGAGRVSER